MFTPNQLTAIDRHLRKENWLLNEDLVTELTDHYANGVGERMAQGMDFDAAIREIHRDFGGRKGLLKMEEDYQASQTRQVGRIIRNTMGSYFRLPRLGTTVLLLIVVYSLIKLLPEKLDLDWMKSWLFIGLLSVTGVLYVFAFVRLITYYRQTSKAKARNQGLVMVFQVINSLFLIGFYVRMWLPIDKGLVQYPLPSSVVVTLFIILELSTCEMLLIHYRKNQQSVKIA